MTTTRRALLAAGPALLLAPGLAHAALAPADQALVDKATAYLQSLQSARGKFVQTDARGASLERSKVGRQPGLMFLALLGATLFLPITMIAALAALVLEGPRRLASLARAFVSPFRHVEERIGVELQPGRLSFAVRQDRRTIVERSFDDASLLAVHAPNRFERKITLFTADELVELPCLARGEPAESFSPPESDALAELAVHVWSWPRSSD